MFNEYIIPKNRREDIEKKIARLQKKAATYGKELNVRFGETFIERVNVNKLDPVTHTWYKADEADVEVFSLEIESEAIVMDGYEVIAKIEHLENGNFVTVFNDSDAKPEWYSVKGRCEHCNSNRARKITFIVRDEEGNDKQVGSGCLKDYCGIDPQMIGWYNQIEEIFMKDDVRGGIEYERAEYCWTVESVLAIAIEVNKEQGYRKSYEIDSNKCEIRKRVLNCRMASEENVMAAKTIIDDIKNSDDVNGNIFANNISLCKNGWCKDNHLGFIAYLPVEYEKLQKRREELAKRNAEKESQSKTSNYVGEIGKRIEIDVKESKLITSWENAYGTTFLYKMTDGEGNVFVWFASKPFGEWKKSGEFVHFKTGRIKATVKDHSERDGVKQTVITRCKAA